MIAWAMDDTTAADVPGEDIWVRGAELAQRRDWEREQVERELRHLPACDIPHCGNRRCDDCGERMTCLGAEPRACTTTCVDCSCSCQTCQRVAEDVRDDLLRKIQQEAS